MDVDGKADLWTMSPPCQPCKRILFRWFAAIIDRVLRVCLCICICVCILCYLFQLYGAMTLILMHIV